MRCIGSRSTAVILVWLLGLHALRGQDPSGNEDAKEVIPPQIARLGDNCWLKLATPAIHPITRSSSPWMAYAPDAGSGILWGCSHSYHHNDVWTYDLRRNLWKEV